MTRRGKVEIHRRHLRRGGIGKVNGDDTAPGRGHLVHQAAGLAEEAVFRVLAHDGEIRGGERARTEKTVHNRADEHLKGRRGGKAAALENVRGDISIKAGDGEAALCRLGADPAHQGGSGTLFTLHGGQRFQREGEHVVALGLDAHGLLAVCRRCRQHVHIHRGRQHLAPLVIRVVAADLGSAGG